MKYTSIIIPFVGGLGMFIYGMQIMAQGLENAAGNRMKSLLEALTKNKFFGVLLGAFITAVIQSSSATTVMVVGFVNAGIMNLQQAMGVIMGANIGTTVTGWLVSSVEWAKFLSPSNLAPVAIMIGVIIMLTGKRRSTKDIASIVVGFGLLFVGISSMSVSWNCGGYSSYGDHPEFICIGRNPAEPCSSRSCTIWRSNLYYHGTEYRYLRNCNPVQCGCKEKCENRSADASDL